MPNKTHRKEKVSDLFRTFSEPDKGAKFQAIYRALTQKQQAAIDAIIAGQILGRTIDELIASGVLKHSSYYGRNGWRHNPQFQEALHLAREKYRDVRMAALLAEARDIITEASPDAARVLRHKLTVEEESLKAAEDILELAGVKAETQGGGVQIVINDAEWKPN